MTMGTADGAAAAAHWLAAFETALAAASDPALRSLFHADCHWRDVLALTWSIQTVSGLDAVVDGLRSGGAQAVPSRFSVDPSRTPPRHVTRAGTAAIEAIFTFET
ncbi:MAG TPA: monooxygenase, partial [Vineibacter sp.]|nr:monooxygenase [Vineibacter sp.]